MHWATHGLQVTKTHVRSDKSHKFSVWIYHSNAVNCELEQWPWLLSGTARVKGSVITFSFVTSNIRLLWSVSATTTQRKLLWVCTWMCVHTVSGIQLKQSVGLTWINVSDGVQARLTRTIEEGDKNMGEKRGRTKRGNWRKRWSFILKWRLERLF